MENEDRNLDDYDEYDCFNRNLALEIDYEELKRFTLEFIKSYDKPIVVTGIKEVEDIEGGKMKVPDMTDIRSYPPHLSIMIRDDMLDIYLHPLEPTGELLYDRYIGSVTCIYGREKPLLISFDSRGFNKMTFFRDLYLALATSYFSLTARDMLFSSDESENSQPWDTIPDKMHNKQILKMWWDGFTSSEIAKEVDRDSKTITNIISSMRVKYGPEKVPLDQDRRRMKR